MTSSPQTFVVVSGVGAGAGADEGSPPDTGPATATTSAIGAAEDEGSPPDTGPVTATTSAIGAAEGEGTLSDTGPAPATATSAISAAKVSGVGVGDDADEDSLPDTGPATATTSAIGAAEGFEKTRDKTVSCNKITTKPESFAFVNSFPAYLALVKTSNAVLVTTSSAKSALSFLTRPENIVLIRPESAQDTTTTSTILGSTSVDIELRLPKQDEGAPSDTGSATATTSAIGAAEGSLSPTTTWAE
ncbi:hypothetical protein V6N12_008647 [Hibiscus sabdariffa]|uniref:Uncharacterized protein n=1 Tax=Hibiscus sabdariffa TaxID=183260 RepID=A0ABR2BJF8_9ROSI